MTLGLEGGVNTITHAGRRAGAVDHLPMQRYTEQKISKETLYCTQFLTSESLRKDGVSRHKVDLSIGPDLPKVVLEAKELEQDANSSVYFGRWWLEVQVDVVRGRNPSVRQFIDVTLSKAARSLKPLRISE